MRRKQDVSANNKAPKSRKKRGLRICSQSKLAYLPLALDLRAACKISKSKKILFAKTKYPGILVLFRYTHFSPLPKKIATSLTVRNLVSINTPVPQPPILILNSQASQPPETKTKFILKRK